MGLVRGHLIQQAAPWQEQLYRNYSNKIFLSTFLKISLGNQCQHFISKMARKLLLVSHLRAHCMVSPPEVSGISRLDLRTQPFKYKIEQNLKYQHIIHSVQQAGKGSGKDGAFTVCTERTYRR